MDLFCIAEVFVRDLAFCNDVGGACQIQVGDVETVAKNIDDQLAAAHIHLHAAVADFALLGKNGVYANYTGMLLLDGEQVQVAGRVHAVCVDKVLYTIHLTAPRAQWNDYKDMVYDKLRDTLTIVK